MNFSLSKEDLLIPLQQVIGVVDKKNLQPILSFVLLEFVDNEMIITATDLDIELSAKVNIEPQNSIGKLVLPAKKTLDICKSLPDNSRLNISYDKNNNKKVIISCNKSKFSLSTLDLEQENFPRSKKKEIKGFSFSILQNKLKEMLNATSFAIAPQDVRHYLMGMLWEFNHNEFKTVASDGHRLALGQLFDKGIFPNNQIRVIIPKKSINELLRLLDDGDNNDIIATIEGQSVQIVTNNIVFVTKTIDHQFPDYKKAFVNKDNMTAVDIDKSELKQLLLRVAILTNEKNRAVRLCFNAGQLVALANNPDQEEAEESINIDSKEVSLEICLNVGYLLDVINKIHTDKIRLYLKEKNTPVLITPAYESGDSGDSDNSITNSIFDYIIMPMCL